MTFTAVSYVYCSTCVQVHLMNLAYVNIGTHGYSQIGNERGTLEWDPHVRIY